MRSGCSSGNIQKVLLFWGRFYVQKPLSQIQGSTFSHFQDTFTPPPFGGSGLKQRGYDRPGNHPGRAAALLTYFPNELHLQIITCKQLLHNAVTSRRNASGTERSRDSPPLRQSL